MIAQSDRIIAYLVGGKDRRAYADDLGLITLDTAKRPNMRRAGILTRS